jgi:hypothetical protein
MIHSGRIERSMKTAHSTMRSRATKISQRRDQIG